MYDENEYYDYITSLYHSDKEEDVPMDPSTSNTPPSLQDQPVLQALTEHHICPYCHESILTNIQNESICYNCMIYFPYPIEDVIQRITRYCNHHLYSLTRMPLIH